MKIKNYYEEKESKEMERLPDLVRMKEVETAAIVQIDEGELFEDGDEMK